MEEQSSAPVGKVVLFHPERSFGRDACGEVSDAFWPVGIKTRSLRNLCLLSVVLLPSDNLGPKFQHGCAKPEKANLKGVVGDRGWLRALARGS